MDRFKIIACIRFSKHAAPKKNNKFSVGEITSLHQHIALGVELSRPLKNKIEDLIKEIKASGWQYPEVRYNNELAIEINIDGQWIKQK